MGFGIHACFDDSSSIRGVVWINVQNQIATSLRQDGANISDSFFAISFGDQRDIFAAHRLGKISTSLIPGRVIRIGEGSDRIYQDWLAICGKQFTRYST